MTPNRSHTPLAIALVLFSGTLALFWPTLRFEFTGFDDDIYVTDNAHLNDGLTWKAVRWAFTTTYANFWHPLTWLSHLVDVELFGMNPSGHHFTSVLLHALNTLLV